MEIIIGYLTLINAITCIAFAVDKNLARRGHRRIPEANLLLLAIAGGSIGGILGMYLFRHKTRHVKFKWGLPLILLLQVGLFLMIKQW
jgi:uncharacterized membrane protein YsdA (DUF1294 family)